MAHPQSGVSGVDKGPLQLCIPRKWSNAGPNRGARHDLRWSRLYRRPEITI